MEERAEVGGRRHMRVGYPAGTVTVRSHRSGSFLPGTLVDISISGCLITMAPPIEVARSQVIELRFDLNSLGFRVLGFVRHVNPKTNAIGVEFHHLAENDKRDLEAFIEYFLPVEVG